MHEKQTEAFVNRILDIVRTLTIIQDINKINPEDHKDRPFFHISASDLSFNYGFREHELIHKLISDIKRKTDKGNNISNKYISNQLSALFKSLLATKQSPQQVQLIADFLAELPHAVERQVVMVPVRGIELRVDHWDVGRMRLMNVDQAKLETLMSTPLQSFAKHGVFLEKAVKGVYVVIELDAETTHANEMALQEARRAIDLLRFAATLTPSPSVGRYLIALENEINPKDENRHIFGFPVASPRFTLDWGADGGKNQIWTWAVTREAIDELEQAAIKKVSEILRVCLISGIMPLWGVDSETRDRRRWRVGFDGASVGSSPA